MNYGIDALAEAIRLAGVVVMATAVALEWLDHRRHSALLLISAGVLLLSVGSLAVLVATVAPIAARLEESVLPLALEYFRTTTHGPQLLTPILPAVYALLLAEGLRVVDAPGLRRGLCWMLTATLVAILALMAAGGHVASSRLEHLGMVLQIVHMVTAVAWVALVLALLPRMLRRDPLADLLGRVGNFALALVLALFASGIGSAWIHGAPLPWPMDDAYGQLLLLKTGTLLLALAAAGWNRFVELRPPVVNEPGIRRILALETCILFAALMLAAWLTRTPPPG
ncbi:MAG: hypothetical protein EA417_16305 [Gammaproteobacteria bacterium]|nr:MAG: hypothetical protein EA417_16305 [Gammaproteobacteria bacterium]